ncbi:MAG: hypothetical protein O7B27_09445, partial [Gammaproteobacteria bacterium]|nr:hypothetical protein [Gammaproteobacteria bacterium]
MPDLGVPTINKGGLTGLPFFRNKESMGFPALLSKSRLRIARYLGIFVLRTVAQRIFGIIEDHA